MSGRARAFVLALFAAAALLAAAAPAVSALPRTFWGVVTQGEMIRADFDHLAQGNVGTLRVMFVWADWLQPGGTSSCCNWAPYDYYVTNAANSGTEVLPYIIGGPSRYTDNFIEHPPVKGKAADAWQHFLRELVRRYGRNGSYWNKADPYNNYRPITTWQIWNEPSSPDYWNKPNPKEYAKLVKLSAQAIHSVDRKAEVMLAGLFAPRDKKGRRMDLEKFMRRFYGVPKIARYFDVAAIHPYAATNKALKEALGRMRGAMREGHDAQTPLRVTEIGWASGGPKSPFTQTPEGQAEKLTKAFGLLQRGRDRWRLHGVDWFALQDYETSARARKGAGICKWCPETGLFRTDRSAKPAWDAYQAFSR